MWDKEDVVFCEWFPSNVTITAEVHCQQFHRLEVTVQERRPKRLHRLILQHDAARSHTGAIHELCWEIIPHPPCSLDLASSDFHLLHSLLNNLRGISLVTTRS